MTANRVKSGSASTSVATITFAQYYNTVEIVNASATAGEIITVTTDGTTAPTSLGDDMDVAYPGKVITVRNRGVAPGQGAAGGGTVVKLISATGTPAYTVTGK